MIVLIDARRTQVDYLKTHLVDARHPARGAPFPRRRRGCGCWRRSSPLWSSADHRRLPWPFWGSCWDPSSIVALFSRTEVNGRKNRHLTSSHRTHRDRAVSVVGVVVRIFGLVTSLTNNKWISFTKKPVSSHLPTLSSLPIVEFNIQCAIFDAIIGTRLICISN